MTTCRLGKPRTKLDTILIVLRGSQIIYKA
jgi:hypothetical protein